MKIRLILLPFLCLGASALHAVFSNDLDLLREQSGKLEVSVRKMDLDYGLLSAHQKNSTKGKKLLKQLQDDAGKLFHIDLKICTLVTLRKVNSLLNQYNDATSNYRQFLVLQKELHELELVELNQPDTASVIDKLQIQIDIWQKEVAISQMQYDYHKSSDLAYMYKQSVEWKQHLVDEKMKKLADELERQKPLEITDSAKDSVAMSDPKNQKAQDEVKVSVAVDIQRKQENLQQSNDQKSTVPLNEVAGKQESSLPFVQELHNNNSRKKLVAKVTALVTIPAYYLYKKKDQKKVENN